MKPSGCSRLFEVEALRDGRLIGAERAKFERHLASCAVCGREAQELAALGRAIVSSHVRDADELHVRRERTRLLAAFDRSLIDRPSPWSLRRAALAVGAVVAIAALFLVWGRRSGRESTGEAALVRASGGAVWSRAKEANRERIVLERGRLWIRVVRAPARRPLVIVLPDGELEDIGTTFSVEVEAGHTARVAVQEGKVVLRLLGAAPVLIEPGKTWTPAVEPEPEPSGLSPVEPIPSMKPSPKGLAAPPSASRRSSQSPARATAPEASSDFRDAMAALNRGENAAAGSMFARFVARHPRDVRAEDAAYLRVLALERSGNGKSMRAAAADYLRRYPTGFRRSEVERLVR